MIIIALSAIIGNWKTGLNKEDLQMMKRKQMVGFIDNSSYFLREVVSDNCDLTIDKNDADTMYKLISKMHDMMVDYLYENYTEDGDIIE